MTNAILQAGKLGQSFWFDTLSRRLLVSGELRRMIEEDGLRGVTSNPSIFAKAMVGTGDYDADLRALVGEGMRDAKAIYEDLAIADIRAAADLLHPTYVASNRSDGFVSLEVSPHLAHSTEATVVEGRRLFHEVQRENVMIKVPGTPEGMPAIARLIGDGVNVNVTLLFGLDAYRACASAHLDGLERLQACGGDLRHVSGVASFFLSRIDTAADERIAAALAKNPDPEIRTRLEQLRGKIAIANAKLAYVHFQEIMASPRWHALAALGAYPQRLLWASTGTKNPAYSSTMYIDSLIGQHTVNTVPAETYRAFLEPGRPQPTSTLTTGLPDAAGVIAALGPLGLDLDQITDDLLEKGIATFSEAFDKLLGSLDHQLRELAGPAGAGVSAPA